MTTIFSPASVPYSAPEIVNPLRGEYYWERFVPQPVGWPVLDSYRRFEWFQVEPTPGNYDFSAIDSELADAGARSGGFGFRIMAACTGCASLTNAAGVRFSVPPYMQGNTTVYTVDGVPNGIPNWNSAGYLDRLDALIDALARHITSAGVPMNQDPRLSFIDAFSYGNWGEWHDYPYSPNPMLTDVNAERIINHLRAAFPDCYMLQLTSQQHALSYAITHGNGMVGVRADMLGSPNMGGALDYMNTVGPVALNAWQNAPMGGEWAAWDAATHADMFAEGLKQTSTCHTSMFSSGNYSPAAIASWPAQSQTDLANANKNAGYRVQIKAVRLDAMTPGSPFTCAIDWQNVGNTPPYGHWQVSVQLRTPGTTTVIWEGVSSFPISSWKGVVGLLPTGGINVTTSSDSWTLPTDMAAGVYEVAVVVRNLLGSYKPMNLAITNARASDGAYVLGTASVVASGPAPIYDAYDTQIMADAPIAYWRLGEASGAMLADFSGHGHFVSVGSGVTLGQIGAVAGDSAARFDSAVARAPLDLSGQTTVSLEFWLRWDTYASDDRLAFEFSSASLHFDQSNGFLINPNSSSEVGGFEIAVGTTTGTRTLGGHVSRPPAGWHHHVYVMNRATPAITAYIDGKPATFTHTVQNATAGPFGNGMLYFMSRHGLELFGAGLLDEVAVYGGALSAARVMAHFSAAAKSVVSGSRGGNAALESLLSTLAALGTITDNTTP